MKKNFTLKGLGVALLAMTMVACSSSNEVVSGRMITKRKHNKGFHFNMPERWKAGEESTLETAETVNKKAVEKVIIQEETRTVVAPVDEASTVIAQEIASEPAVTETENGSDAIGEKAEKSRLTASIEELHHDRQIQKQEQKQEQKKSKKEKRPSDIPVIILYILCFMIPPIAVGLATDWDLKPVIINLLLCFLFVVPGIIHALIVVSRNS